MSRDTEYKFVPTDSSAIMARLISAYENMTGRTLQPADPDRLFIAWVADVIIQERVNQNYTGNQNIPSRAVGENLDSLGDWIYGIKRLSAQVSKCTVRFNITATQQSAIIIPAGTRVTDASRTLVWHTTADSIIAIGDTYADVMVQCETAGTIGNGYVAGQINTLIDVDNIQYFASCANIETSNGGSEEASDEEYYELMMAGLDSYSTAGPTGAYEYWAKSVSTTIEDVKAIQPKVTVKKSVSLCTDADGIKVAFVGGDNLLPETLSVYVHNTSTKAEFEVDYTYDYSDNLLCVKIISIGVLSTADKIDIEIDTVKSGCVYIYALMDDGTLADSTVKSAILAACNGDTVRPMTDKVSCEDAEYVDYNIELTYYVQRNSRESLANIQIAVSEAVAAYVKWQSEKMGRDINPSELAWRLGETGIKRTVISSPSFTKLRNGQDHTVPQVARMISMNIINGGFEDE